MALRKIAKLPIRHNTFASLLLGLSMGIALSLVITPLIDEECSVAIEDHFSGGRSLQSEAVATAPDALSDAEDYEPRVLSNMPPRPQSAESNSKPLIRPRFYSTELGIKEKLFIGILSDSKTIETISMAINATLAHHVDKLMFFVDGTIPKKLNMLQSVVGFAEASKSSHPYRAIEYIGEHHINDYDYYFLALDSVYVRGMKLKLMVSGISVGQLVYMGHAGNRASSSCDLQRGILFSQQVLRLILQNLDWCKQNSNSEDSGVNIGACVFHSMRLSCSSTIQGNSFASLNLDDSFHFDRDISTVGKQSEFTSALTLFPVTTQETFYKLHLHYTMLDLKETEKEILNLQSNIASINQYLPPEMQSKSWPIGVSAPSKAKDRFSVIQWDYLTKTHVFPDSDFSSVRLLTSLEKQDLDEIMNASLTQLRLPELHGKSDAAELVNCYRRFDPARGMEYILDIAVKDPMLGSLSVKRMEAIRALGKVEMIPVPYVTENTRLVLLLPISEAERDSAVRFLKDFAEVCLEKNDNAVLVLMFVTSKNGNGNDDNFAALKGLINTYNNKYQTEGAKVSWISVKNVEVQPATFGVLDLITKKFPAESLFVICQSGMEIRTEFLNRARMNTIQGWQVFFPIPFTQYNPDIVFSKIKSRPEAIEVNKIHGHFDIHDFDIFSFYNSDYQAGRKLMEKHIPIVRSERDLKDARHHAKTGHNVFEMFLDMKSVHVMRAVEPYLRNLKCPFSESGLIGQVSEGFWEADFKNDNFDCLPY